MSNRDNVVVKANQAKALLEDPVLTDAWESIDKITLASMRRINLGTPEGKEYALEHVRMMQANARQRQILENYVSQGQQVLASEGRVDPMEPFRLADPRYTH